MTDPGPNTDRNLDELSIFHEVAKALTSSLDLDTILQTIMEKMAAYFEPATWCLLMVDEGTEELYYAAAVGKECEFVNSLRLRSGESLARWVVEHKDGFVSPDVRNDARIQTTTDGAMESCSIVCLPVVTGGRALGIIQLASIDMEVYQRNQQLLQTLADYAAIAIDNAHAVRRIQELSITDSCTGLYNARHLFGVLAEEINRSQRFGYEFSLVFLDCDHFKRINDRFGHLIGSQLLGEVGRCLRENLRLVDAAFRYGGDEFAILLPQTSRESALLVARRLMAIFRRRDWLAEEKLDITLRASVGVANFPADAKTPQALLRRADELMYEVKQAGRDNIAVTGMGIVGLK